MSDMTPAQRAWLTKLRDEGPREWHKSFPLCCINRGWAEWVNPDSASGDFRERITPAGLAALVEAEARDE